MIEFQNKKQKLAYLDDSFRNYPIGDLMIIKVSAEYEISRRVASGYLE